MSAHGQCPDLLPCPFCGGKAEFKEDEQYGALYVGCVACDIHTVFYTDAGGAAEVWNERATSADVERLTRERDDLKRDHTALYAQSHIDAATVRVHAETALEAQRERDEAKAALSRIANCGNPADCDYCSKLMEDARRALDARE